MNERLRETLEAATSWVFQVRCINGCDAPVVVGDVGRQERSATDLRTTPPQPMCKSCINRWQYQNRPAYRAAIAANAARYDAVKRGAPPDGDLITLAEVAELDGWICQLCGDAVDPTLPSPHPGSASIDHVIPLALRGPHRWSNVQLAHRSCNSRKGART